MKKSFVDASKLNQKEAEALFASSVQFRNVLVSVLDGKYADKVKKSFSSKNFEKPSWAEEQAYNLGYLAALEEVIGDLLEKKA